jgi:hypothetical protein
MREIRMGRLMSKKNYGEHGKNSKSLYGRKVQHILQPSLSLCSPFPVVEPLLISTQDWDKVKRE